MILKTDRLSIIPCTEETLAEFSTDSFELRPHITMHIEQVKEDSSLIGWGVWLVIDKETNRIVGDIGFKGKPNKNGIVEVGYGIDPSAQGKGFATESVRALIEWAFTFEEVDKVIAECLEDNAPSIRVLEKMEMKQTETKNGMIYWEMKK